MTRASQSIDVVELYDGVLPSLVGGVAAQVGPLDAYRIEAVFDPEGATIEGRVDVTFVNRTATELRDVVLRLYPNDPVYLEAGMTIRRVRVGKENLPDPAALLSVEGNVLRAPLAEPLAPGEDVRLRIDFTTALLSGPFEIGSFLGQDVWTGTWLLADWHPVIAPWLLESGWYVDPLNAEAGPVVAENALYDVTLRAPDLLVLVATGTEVSEEERGRQLERRWVTGPVRSFVVVADDDYSQFTEEVDGTLVSAYADWDDPAMVNYARLALEIEVESLVAYGDRFGPYPFTELDVIVLPHLGGSGFAASGMIFVSVYYGESDDPNSPNWYEPDRVFFEHAVAHEVGHQWWGLSVESNHRDHAYLAEGLTNYLAVEFRRWTDGDEMAEALLIDVVAQQYVDLLPTLGDEVADRTGRGDLGPAHVGIVYGKAALGFLAIHLELGDEAFFAALRAYAEEFAFGIAVPADLLRSFEDASGRELDDLWRRWFEDATTSADEVRDLIRAA